MRQRDFIKVNSDGLRFHLEGLFQRYASLRRRTMEQLHSDYGGERPMPRILAFIAVLALIGTTATSALAQQPQSKSSPKNCYNPQTCAADCNRTGYRYCERYCQRAATTQPACR
jgi:hypothetical protein